MKETSHEKRPFVQQSNTYCYGPALLQLSNFLRIRIYFIFIKYLTLGTLVWSFFDNSGILDDYLFKYLDIGEYAYLRIWKGWHWVVWVTKTILSLIFWPILGFGLFFYAVFLILKAFVLSLFFFKMSWNFGISYSQISSKSGCIINHQLLFFYWHCLVFFNKYVFYGFLNNLKDGKFSYFKVIIYIAFIRLIFYFIEDFLLFVPRKTQAVLFFIIFIIYYLYSNPFCHLGFPGVGLLVYFILFIETVLLLVASV